MTAWPTVPFANEFIVRRVLFRQRLRGEGIRTGQDPVFLDILRRRRRRCLRVFRDVNPSSRFSHGALHPLLVGEACE